jgi:hypothetical protein
MKTHIDLLNETEEILLKLLVQYQPGQYTSLTKAIINVRILKIFCNPTIRAADGANVSAESDSVDGTPRR